MFRMQKKPQLVVVTRHRHENKNKNSRFVPCGPMLVIVMCAQYAFVQITTLNEFCVRSFTRFAETRSCSDHSKTCIDIDAQSHRCMAESEWVLARDVMPTQTQNLEGQGKRMRETRAKKFALSSRKIETNFPTDKRNFTCNGC